MHGIHRRIEVDIHRLFNILNRIVLEFVELRQNTRVVDENVGLDVVFVEIVQIIVPICTVGNIKQLIRELVGIFAEFRDQRFHFLLASCHAQNGAPVLFDEFFGNALTHTA